jgi:hypothetical protein
MHQIGMAGQRISLKGISKAQYPIDAEGGGVSSRPFALARGVPASRRAWLRAAAAFVALAGPLDLLVRLR